MLFDGPPRSFLNAAQHKVRHSAALQRGGMFNQALLVRSDAGLQAFTTGAIAG
jgi:hypothetical protein